MASAYAYALLLTAVASLLAYASARAPANEYVNEIVQTSKQLPELNDYFVDYAHLKGYVFIDKEHHLNKGKEANLSNHFTVTEPMTLFPSPFPKELFEEVWDLQELMARVSLRVSLNYEFLSETMKVVAQHDPFIGKMVNLMEAANGKPRQSGLTLLLQRSDYLTHVEPHGSKMPIGIKQIEVSTGIHGAQGMLPIPLHERMLEKIKYDKEATGEPVSELLNRLKVAQGDSVPGEAMAFYRTWLEFVDKHKDPAAIILLVYPVKRSSYSHFQLLKWLQFKLEDVARKEGTGRPRYVQLTFAECHERLTFVNNHVFLDGDKRVAILYYIGYLPSHFADDRDWDIRLKMELSEAVMVPNIPSFLAGTKKVQQVLAEKDVLEQFFPELNDAKVHNASPAAKEKAVELQQKLDRLRATFSVMHGLGSDSQSEKKLIAAIIADPDDYVLKENLEGGKGNLFGRQISEKLLELGEDHLARSAYILQKKIRPITVKNAFSPIPPAPEEGLRIVNVNSELSIYGALLAKVDFNNAGDKHHSRHKRHNPAARQGVEQQILFNNVDGYMVRTKVIENLMCNLCNGMGGADSLVLFQMSQFHTKSAAATAGEEEEQCAAAGDQFDIEAGPSCPLNAASTDEKEDV